MPRKDGTGPDGKGPKTGRGRGPCKSDNNRSKRRGSDGGRGRRRRNSKD